MICAACGKQKNKPFVRRPYADLQEAQLIAIKPDAPAADLIVGIAVIPLIKGDTNARLPCTLEQVQKQLAKGDVIDLWTPKGFA